jgi:hypothetical protein
MSLMMTSQGLPTWENMTPSPSCGHLAQYTEESDHGRHQRVLHYKGRRGLNQESIRDSNHMPVKHLRLPKSPNERVRECITILKKITEELDIPTDHPSIRVLKARMARYWEDGKNQEERIPLVGSNRYILYRFPHWAHQQCEVTLRAGRITHQQLPSDLEAELGGQTSSEMQSDQVHPSLEGSAER